MPKFHAKARGHFSYKTNCQYPKGKNPTVVLEENMLHVPKTPEDIPLVLHRPLPENAVIKNVTFSMDTDGQFYASIAYECMMEIDVTIREAVISGDEAALKDLKFLGLDYSQQHFYVDSEGRIANYPHYYRKMEEKLAKEQRKLSRMEAGSKNYERQKKKVACLHKKIRNQRLDFINKEVFRLVNAYDVICVEDIDLRAMSQCLSLGKNLSDNGFGMFRTKLSQKLEKKGSVLVKIDRWYPSSKTCSHCGYVNDEVKLGVSEWVCPECGTHHDRDVNGAINIMNEGKRIFVVYFRETIEAAAAAEQKREKAKQARLAKRWNKTDNTAA
jgi:putative transposase